MSQKSSHTVRDAALVVLFLAALALPVTAQMLNLKWGCGPNVARSAFTAPATPHTRAEWQSFPAAFETYYKQNFGFRIPLARLFSRMLLCHYVQSESLSALVGKDGWLFANSDGALSTYRGTDLLSQKKLEIWRTELVAKDRWFKAHGIAFYVVIAPDKHTIYPEYMPESAGPRAACTRADQLVNDLRANTDVQVIDLRPVLQEAKKSERVYHMTDSHWNDRGAFAACQEIASRLHERFPGIAPAVAGAYAETTRPGQGMDLARLMLVPDLLPEETLTLTPARTPPRFSIDYDLASQFDVDDVRHPFAVDTHRRALPRALILRDSFFTPMIPFFYSNFSRSAYYWHTDYDPAALRAEKPDIFIYEFVERTVKYLEPPD